VVFFLWSVCGEGNPIESEGGFGELNCPEFGVINPSACRSNDVFDDHSDGVFPCFFGKQVVLKRRQKNLCHLSKQVESPIGVKFKARRMVQIQIDEGALLGIFLALLLPVPFHKLLKG